MSGEGSTTTKTGTDRILSLGARVGRVLTAAARSLRLPCQNGYPYDRRVVETAAVALQRGGLLGVRRAWPGLAARLRTILADPECWEGVTQEGFRVGH